MFMFMFLTLVFACGSSPEPTEVSATNANPEVPAASPELSGADKENLAEVLKTVDMADGTEDKVAHKCSGCALRMDGKAEHAIEVEGTTLHFCSSSCKNTFSKDTMGNLLKMVN